MQQDRTHEASGFTVTRKQIVAAVLAVVAIVFIAQNSSKGTLHFLVVSWTTRVWIGFCAILLVGVMIGYLLRGTITGRRARSDEAAD